jgi:hypothetical protein
MRSATISACRSENVRTRSSFSARIFSIFADVKALTRGFSRRACGGAHDVTGDADDAVLLAERVQRFDGLFSQADYSARRKHSTLLDQFYLRLLTRSSISAPSASAIR